MVEIDECFLHPGIREDVNETPFEHDVGTRSNAQLAYDVRKFTQIYIYHIMYYSLRVHTYHIRYRGR